MTEHELASRLERMESILAVLLDRATIKDWYTVEEFARLVDREPCTVREYARLGRVRDGNAISAKYHNRSLAPPPSHALP